MKTKVNADEIIEELGLEKLDKADREHFLAKLYASLDHAVGQRLMAELSPAELDKFNSITDETAQLEFIEKRFPDYRQIVVAELDKIVKSVKHTQTEVLKQIKVQRKKEKSK